MADQAGPLAGLTTQDQKLIMGAFKSLRNGFEVSLLSVLLDVCTISGYILFSVCHRLFWLGGPGHFVLSAADLLRG